MSDKTSGHETARPSVQLYTSSIQPDDDYKMIYTSIGDEKKPLLLMIIGSSGVGSLYHRLAIELSTHFRCVYYDKRGFLPRDMDKSTAAKQTNPLVLTERHADDAAALIKRLSPSRPAYVFGTSTGGTCVLDLTIRYPDLVHTAVLHEPITFSVMRDLDLKDEMIGLYRTIGSMADPVKAFPIFADYMFNPPRAQRANLDPEVNELLKSSDNQTRSRSPNAVDLYNGRQGHKEAIAMVEYTVDELKAQHDKEKFIVVCGMESKDMQVSKPGQALALMLGGKRIWELVGDHMSFASKKHAATFAQQLLSLLHQEGRISPADHQRTSHM